MTNLTQAMHSMQGTWIASTASEAPFEITISPDNELWALNLDGSGWNECRGALTPHNNGYAISMRFDFESDAKGVVSPDLSRITWDNGTSWQRID